MSLLSPDRIGIFLSPWHVAMVRLAGRHGGRLLEKSSASCATAIAGEAPWQNALETLESMLADFPTRRAEATLVLSNHLVRYALVDHCDDVTTAQEEAALVRHHFSRVYGSAAEQWELRWSASGCNRDERMASAVAPDVYRALSDLCARSNLRVRSLQPYLMSAFNQLRSRLADSARFALIEHGHLCLARFNKQRWQSIRTARLGRDWLYDLVVQIEREQALSGSDETTEESDMPVFIYATGCPSPEDSRFGEHLTTEFHGHSLRLLRPTAAEEIDPDIEPLYATALLG